MWEAVVGLTESTCLSALYKTDFASNSFRLLLILLITTLHQFGHAALFVLEQQVLRFQHGLQQQAIRASLSGKNSQASAAFFSSS